MRRNVHGAAVVASLVILGLPHRAAGQTTDLPLLTDIKAIRALSHIRHVLCVKDQTGSARIETEQPLGVRPGDLVDVAEPSPLPLQAENMLRAENDAELVRVEAQLLGIVTSPAERVLVLRSRTGDAVFEAALDRSLDSEALNRIRPGSLVTATGVYSYQGGPPPAFRLFLRSAADVVVVAAEPWWTIRHTVVMIVMLALALVIGAVWQRTFVSRQQREYQAVLSERNRVARELHDTLEQGLAGIRLQLEAVAGSLETSPDRAKQSLDVARQMLRYSLEETRRSVLDLRSQALESRDLAGALSSMVRQMTLGTSTVAEVHVAGPLRRLGAAEEHHLLRIGLEALTNALKHGAPRRIDIELRFQSDSVALAIQDDGRGIEAGVEISGSHFGLEGIRERVNKMGGRLDIHSRAGEGTRIVVTIPNRSARGRVARASRAERFTPAYAWAGLRRLTRLLS